VNDGFGELYDGDRGYVGSCRDVDTTARTLRLENLDTRLEMALMHRLPLRLRLAAYNGEDERESVEVRLKLPEPWIVTDDIMDRTFRYELVT
jgi:hypothetical protein